MHPKRLPLISHLNRYLPRNMTGCYHQAGNDKLGGSNCRIQGFLRFQLYVSIPAPFTFWLCFEVPFDFRGEIPPNLSAFD